MPWNPLKEGSTIAVLPTEGPLAGERVEAVANRRPHDRCSPQTTTTTSSTTTSTSTSTPNSDTDTTPTSTATRVVPWNPLKEGSTLAVLPTGLPPLEMIEVESKEVKGGIVNEDGTIELDEEKRNSHEVPTVKRRHFGRNDRRMHGVRVGPRRLE